MISTVWRRKTVQLNVEVVFEDGLERCSKQEWTASPVQILETFLP